MQRRNDNMHAHKAVRFLGTALFAILCFGISYGVLEASPNHVTKSYLRYNNEGYLLAQKGELDTAIPYLKQAVELNPAHPTARNNLANAYRAKKNPDEARRQWEDLLLLSPRSIEAFVGLGNVASDAGLYENAAGYYEKALEMNAAQPIALFNLGNAHYNLRNVRGAIEAYRKSVENAPDFAQAHYNLARAYELAQDFPNALKHLETALKIDPKIDGGKKILQKLLQ